MGPVDTPVAGTGCIATLATGEVVDFAGLSQRAARRQAPVYALWQDMTRPVGIH